MTAAPAPAVAARAEPLELVVSRLRLLVARRAGWLSMLWADEQLGGQAELESALADRDAPEFERSWIDLEPGLVPLNVELAAVEDALANEEWRLPRLMRALTYPRPA